MARPTDIPPMSPPSQAASNVPDDVSLPDTEAAPPQDGGMPAGLPMIQVVATEGWQLGDLPEEAEPNFPDFFGF